MTLDELRNPGLVNADDLDARVEAITRFVVAADGIVPDERLVPAKALARHVGERLSLSPDHTVVALAGATGSGKSSLFNALARMELSTVGLRRPTTANAFACVWGSMGAEPLLDWLDIAPQRRFTRESALDGNDQVRLRGLVLLDLPDLDSVAAGHREEVDRLLKLVDLVVWVTDPQKYADQVIHEQYLHAFRRHRDVSVVVLNQADRLSPADADRCRTDLAQLLAADGLTDVPVLAVSAVSDEPGSGELRDALERAIVARRAALRRLAGDAAGVAADLVDLVEPEAGPALIDVDQMGLLADALAGAAGVSAVAAAVADSYRRRADRALGWRWGRRAARDPVAVVLSTQPAAGQTAAIGLAVRAFTERFTERLPGPWATALSEAARSRMDELPDVLDRVVARTNLEWEPPSWWRVIGAVRWLAGFAALAGAGWLTVRLVQGGELGGPMALLAFGLTVGLLVSAFTIPLVSAGAKAARQRAERRLRVAIRELAREYVLAPVREVLARYANARDAIM